MLDLLGRSDDWQWLRDTLPKDISLDEPREPHGQLVMEELLRWNRKDLCDRKIS